MGTAARLDLEMDQGADFAFQVYWTTGTNRPYYVVSPMRMEIRDQVGQVAITLQTNDTSQDEDGDPDNQSILYNSESGLIQLQITADQTDLLSAQNSYVYDLFAHYVDDMGSGAVRKKRLITGTVTVNGRYTQNV